MDDPRIRLLDATHAARATEALHALDRRHLIIDVGELPVDASGAAATVIAVLARLFAHVTVRGIALLPPANPWQARDTAGVLPAISAVRPRPTRDPDVDVTVAVGAASGPADLHVGGGAYTAEVARTPRTVDGASVARYGHALGLHAAGAFAVNETMKLALGDVGVTVLPLAADGELLWNLVDYRLTAAADLPDPIPVTRPLLLAGCGSVGGTTAALLAMSSGVSGAVVTVDAETLDPTRNPFRYPMLTGDETGDKADWAARLLRCGGWLAVAHGGGIRGWVAGRDRPGFDGVVVSSVDDLAARRDVTDVLARDVVSLGVAGLALHAQRERLGDGFACPSCEYVPAAPPTTQAEMTAQQLGMSVPRVLQLHVTGARLTEADLAACVTAGSITADAARTLSGRRLDDLIARSYAEVGLGRAPGVATTAPPTLQLAAPQVSWLAGTIAAAEICKYLTRLPGVDRRVDVDLTGLPQGFTRRDGADRTGRCLCASAHRRRWMRTLYAADP